MKILKNNLEDSNIEELVIVIDMVNGFVKEGTLASPSIMRVVPRQIEVLKEFINAPKKGIIFIRDCHTKDAVEFKTYPAHCIEGTTETEVIDELAEFVSIEYKKNSTNFVFADGFMSDISKLKSLKKVILMGCLSEVCVLNGAVSLKCLFNQDNRDIDVVVDASAIDTYDAEGHNSHNITCQALKEMESNGIKIFGKEVE